MTSSLVVCIIQPANVAGNVEERFQAGAIIPNKHPPFTNICAEYDVSHSDDHTQQSIS
jgi:hypothetical protein